MLTDEELAAYVKHKRSITYKELRDRLMAQDPHCYWCKQLCVEYPHKNYKKGEKQPADKATIEHLYDRFDPENRYKIYPNHEDKVLACYSCNTLRSEAKVAQLGKEYHQKREQLAIERKKRNIKEPRFVTFAKLNHEQP